MCEAIHVAGIYLDEKKLYPYMNRLHILTEKQAKMCVEREREREEVML